MIMTSKRWMSDMRVRHASDYETEKSLALRVRTADTEKRAATYHDLYEELFRQLPDHPQMVEDRARRQRRGQERLRLAARFGPPDARILQISTGDCAFALEASSRYQRVAVLDCFDEIAAFEGSGWEATKPSNLEVVHAAVPRIPCDEQSFDVVFSDQVVQALHPDDAELHFAEVRRVLVPGGKYVFITPNRASGPHDISVFFDEDATGANLREYTADEVASKLYAAGFKAIHFYLGGHGRYVEVPRGVLSLVESFFLRFPRDTRSRLNESRLTANTYPFLGLNVVAER